MRGRKPVVQCTAGEWRDLCNLVRASVPPPHGYSWRFVWSGSLAKDGDEGAAVLKPLPDELDGKRGQAIVKVAKGLSRQHTHDVMIHEVAHCRDSWVHDGTRGDHDAHYWLVHGEVWHAMKGTRTG